MIMTYTKPNQPDPKVLPKQVLKEQTLTFQKSWYEKYPWLHVDMGTESVLYFHCSKYFKTGKPAQAKSIDPAFVSTGFLNWKKALEKWHHMYTVEHAVSIWLHNKLAQPPMLCEMHLTGYMTVAHFLGSLVN